MNTRKTGTVGDRPERGRVAVLIIVILAVLVMAGWTAWPPVPATVFTGATAADAMQQAVEYLNETANDPVEVYVTKPSVSSDAEWRVVIVE